MGVSPMGGGNSEFGIRNAECGMKEKMAQAQSGGRRFYSGMGVSPMGR